jgi:hypothetical protein
MKTKEGAVANKNDVLFLAVEGKFMAEKAQKKQSMQART